MDQDKLQGHVIAALTKFVNGAKKKHGGDCAAYLTSSAIYRRLRGMFGVTKGRVCYALRKLTEAGTVQATGKGTKKYTV